MRASPDVAFVFALVVDGKPTIAFEAKNFREASQLCKETWLREDLSDLKCNGVALCGSATKLTVRRADDIEIQTYRAAKDFQSDADDLLLAYLVDLDGVPAASQ